MAVTLTPTDLTQPDGELSAFLFPNGDFATLLAGWLSQSATLVEANIGIAAANQNNAAAAWVYYRGFTHIAQRLAALPVSVSTAHDGSMSKTMSSDQRAYFVSMAKHWKSVFDAYDTTPALTTDGVFPGSLMVNTVARW